jgi:hypothetical protein
MAAPERSGGAGAAAQCVFQVSPIYDFAMAGSFMQTERSINMDETLPNTTDTTDAVLFREEAERLAAMESR